MTEAADYASVVEDLWRVVQVLRGTPIDGLLEVTQQLEHLAPDAGYLNGTLTPRRLRRNARMLTALRTFQSELRTIDSRTED
jgi:hypothetical protein